MTVRTFKQEGKGYGSAPVEIRARLDGAIVYEGPVATVDEDLPDVPDETSVVESVLFTWESTVDFAGTFELSIEVLTPDTLIVSNTLATHVDSADLTKFGVFYLNNDIGDPFTSVLIDDVTAPRVRNLDPDNILNGQWWHEVMHDQVLTATVNVQAGINPTA